MQRQHAHTIQYINVHRAIGNVKIKSTKIQLNKSNPSTAQFNIDTSQSSLLISAVGSNPTSLIKDCSVMVAQQSQLSANSHSCPIFVTLSLSVLSLRCRAHTKASLSTVVYFELFFRFSQDETTEISHASSRD
jgi:hypothetical protein